MILKHPHHHPNPPPFTLDYLLVKEGVRFSAKAAMPSF